MPFSTKLIRELDKLQPDLKAVMLEMLSEIERSREESITRKEFLDFAHHTEENSKRIWQSIDKLAQAQERTERRVEQLAEAQQRTEQRLEKLTERVDQLARAQQRTEEALTTLAEEHRETRRQLGGISGTLGYTLEDRAYLALPKLLEKDYGITLEEELTRDFVQDNKGEKTEVNILGRGRQNGNEILIVGESKSQLSKNNIDDFVRKKLRRLEGTHPHLFAVVVAYRISEPDVKDYAREKGVAIYLSHQFRPIVIY